MGAKTWMISYSNESPREVLKDNSDLDRKETMKLVQKLFPNDSLEELSDGDLMFTNPPKNEILAGYYSGVFILATDELAIDNPSMIDKRFLTTLPSYSLIQVHAMHSVVDWFAYGIWKDGSLKRALSLSPDSGVIEDIGDKLPFEEPYWGGKYPIDDFEDEDFEYPFDFHPLEFGESALLHLFGYCCEGPRESELEELFEPENYKMLRFKRTKNSGILSKLNFHKNEKYFFILVIIIAFAAGLLRG